MRWVRQSEGVVVRSGNLTLFYVKWCRSFEWMSVLCCSSDKNAQSKPAVPRYYGRRKEDQSSSELSIDSDSSESDEDAKNKWVYFILPGVLKLSIPWVYALQYLLILYITNNKINTFNVHISEWRWAINPIQTRISYDYLDPAPKSVRIICFYIFVLLSF